MLERIGARKTLLRIMVLWGITAAAMMFVQTPTQFYVAALPARRFEAGLFPGVILYFTYWYPSVRRGQVIAIFMSATTIVSVIAGPLCGATLNISTASTAGRLAMAVPGAGSAGSVLGVDHLLLPAGQAAERNWLTPAEKVLLRYILDVRREGLRRASRPGS